MNLRIFPRSATAREGRRARRGRLLLSALCLLLLGAVAYPLWQLWDHGRAIQRELNGAQTTVARLRSEPLDVEVWEALALQLAAVDGHAREMHRVARPLLGLSRHLGWVPRWGAVLKVAPDLADAGLDLLGYGQIVANEMASRLGDVDATGKGDAWAAVNVLMWLASSDLPWAEISRSLAELDRGLAAMDGSDLPDPWPGRIARARDLLPVAIPVIDAMPSWPNLLGASGKRSFLVLAQNSDELRPTGGFISGVGVITMENGRVTDIHFRDSYAVDDLAKPHPSAPPAMAKYLGGELLFLRDANWSPDFPTAARIAMALYAQDQGQAVDGVVAIDLHAVRLLVGALGPLDVPGVAEAVTGDNVLAHIKAAWDQPAEGVTIEENAREWWRHRKDFMPALASAALSRLEAGDVDWRRLAWALWQAAKEKHVLIYVEDPAAQQAIERLGWDGGLHPGDGDYLAVFDTNVGFNKVNAAVTREMAYRLGREGDRWLGRLTITYTHPVQVFLEDCVHRPEYGRTYEDMVRRCYWNYVRVYVPSSAELIEARGLEEESISVEPGEKDLTVIAGHFVMRPGSQHVVNLLYRLPDEVFSDGRYRLQMQSQPGMVGVPVIVELVPDDEDKRVWRQRAVLRSDWSWELSLDGEQAIRSQQEAAK